MGARSNEVSISGVRTLAWFWVKRSKRKGSKIHAPDFWDLSLILQAKYFFWLVWHLNAGMRGV